MSLRLEKRCDVVYLVTRESYRLPIENREVRRVSVFEELSASCGE